MVKDECGDGWFDDEEEPEEDEPKASKFKELLIVGLYGIFAGAMCFDSLYALGILPARPDWSEPKNLFLLAELLCGVVIYVPYTKFVISIFMK